MSRFNTIVIAFVSVAVVLCVALAYNIGGTAEETRALKMGAITRKRMSTIRERLAMCVSTNKASDEGNLSKETVTNFLQETNQLLVSENALFLQQNHEGVHLLEECTKHLRDTREELTGATESNATHLVEVLEDEKLRLEGAIRDANETRELNRVELRRLVQAYRLELARLAGGIAKLQKAAMQAAKQAAMQQAENVTLNRPLVVIVSNSTTTTEAPTPQEIVTEPLTTAAVVQDNVTEAPEPTTEEATTTTTTTGAPVPIEAAPVATAGPPPIACPHSDDQYSIMMDAGSTGSRTHVYHFKTTNGTLTLQSEVFESLRPGLSSFKDDPDAAAESLVPLMEIAVKSVPKEYAACTPIALKATAGLRLLGEEKSQLILQKVTAVLKRYPFAVGENAAIVMDASDEGPYAWVTVNFLLGNLKTGGRTAAIMDMGGASTQVVFAPEDPAVLSGAPKEYVYTAKIAGAALTAYQHSFLGLGLKEAGNTLVKAAARVGGDFECFPRGYVQEVDGVKVTNTVASSFGDCVNFIREHLLKHTADDEAACTHKPCPFRGVYMPNLTDTFKGPVYAFSYFYDRMEQFMTEDSTYTVASFQEMGKNLCDSTEEKYASKNLGTMCMDFAFLYSILHYGYGLEDARELLIKKKIDGYETAWPLGASLVALASTA